MSNEENNQVAILLNDSYDVEVSVASSAIFGSPYETRGLFGQESDPETSLIDDRMLGVSSPTPPATEGSNQGDEEKNVVPPTPSMSEEEKRILDLSKVPTTITMPSPDASAAAIDNGGPFQLEWPKITRRRILCLAAILALAVGIIAACLFLILPQKNSSEKSISVVSSAEEEATSTLGITSDPPSDVPSLSPSFDPATSPALNFIAAAESFTAPNLLQDPSSPQGKAIQWLNKWWSSYNSSVPESKMLQRYALVVLDFALHSNGDDTDNLDNDAGETSVADPLQDECSWLGVDCGDGSSSQGMAQGLNWANQSLSGEIPPEIGLLTSLIRLDLGENEIRGSIPDALNDLSQLQYLFLHRNQLTGTISERIANLPELINFYADNNQLSGPLPLGLRSTQLGYSYARPLRSLSLHRNKLDGPLLSQTNWRNMWYLDLSYNQFTGQFPEDWVEGQDSLNRIRHLYLDHNLLTGSLPTSLGSIGNGRLEQLLISDNKFTGTVPGNYLSRKSLIQMELQNNKFTDMSKDICDMIVFEEGELVNFRADCDICECKYLCGINDCY